LGKRKTVLDFFRSAFRRDFCFMAHGLLAIKSSANSRSTTLESVNHVKMAGLKIEYAKIPLAALREWPSDGDL
jgi:hypothetical protein